MPLHLLSTRQLTISNSMKQYGRKNSIIKHKEYYFPASSFFSYYLPLSWELISWEDIFGSDNIKPSNKEEKVPWDGVKLCQDVN